MGDFKEVTRKGYISRMKFFNPSNDRMRELTENEIGMISNFFEQWINMLRRY